MSLNRLLTISKFNICLLVLLHHSLPNVSYGIMVVYSLPNDTAIQCDINVTLPIVCDMQVYHMPTDITAPQFTQRIIWCYDSLIIAYRYLGPVWYQGHFTNCLGSPRLPCAS